MKQLVLAFSLLFLSGIACATPVNINTADEATIAAALANIGPAKAAAIVEYRKANGPFKTVEELLNVKGIGEKTLAIIKADVLLADPAESKDKKL